MNGCESQYEGSQDIQRSGRTQSDWNGFVRASINSKAVYRATIVNRTLGGISKIEQPLRSGASTGAINR